MPQSQSTRRSFLISALAMFLSFLLLIGSTFAWFTDSASTSVNRIVAGELKIDIQNAKGESLKNGALNWQKAEGHEEEKILWEPNCTYSLEPFRIVNLGSLALKFRIEVTGFTGDSDLLDVISFAYESEGESFDLSAERTLKKGEQTGLITMTGHMDKNAGNYYQGMTLESIAITVYAAQAPVEADSIDNTYDERALYPVVAAAPIELDENNALVKDTVITSGATADGSPAVKVTIPAGTPMKENATMGKISITEDVTPANFQVDITQMDPRTLDIHMEGLSEENTNLIRVEFYLEPGLEIVEFYHNGRKMDRRTALKWLSNDQDFFYDSATGKVTMLTSSFSPFTYTADKFQWRNAGRYAAEYSTPVDTGNKILTIATPEELALFAHQITNGQISYADYTIRLAADIDLGAGFWTSINAGSRLNRATIDGQGHTIRNLLVRNCTNSSGYGFAFIGDAGSSSLTIRNLTFDSANVKYAKYGSYMGNVGGVVLGYAYGTTVFDNVTVQNSLVEGYGKIGALLGMGAQPGMKITFRNCTSQNNELKAVYNVGGLAGNIQRGQGADNTTIENATVKNITFTADPRETYADVNGTATLKSNDLPSGEDVEKAASGKYWVYGGYLWGGFADYYVSYGTASYDAPVTGSEMLLANSELVINR